MPGMPQRKVRARAVKVNAMAATKDLTIVVKVKRLREFKIRIWLAKKVMRLGAWIAGCWIVFEDK